MASHAKIALTAVEVEDVAGAGDNEELDRPPELGEPLRQAAGLLDASRVSRSPCTRNTGILWIPPDAAARPP